ncbi:hypothetical protein GGX14DRAFT_661575 [Mycena pura]|uniref:Mitochondrial splicing suppressor 51-like C-terminal domain-containing protein n=1 Tax=Mycena pura TaxID=153505 RepID=A0AAD6V136_9AGAR|nr:hypothetical protein GGX14DRAFT_661575 [Mycena pura]
MRHCAASELVLFARKMKRDTPGKAVRHFRFWKRYFNAGGCRQKNCMPLSFRPPPPSPPTTSPPHKTRPNVAQTYRHLDGLPRFGTSSLILTARLCPIPCRLSSSRTPVPSARPPAPFECCLRRLHAAPAACALRPPHALSARHLHVTPARRPRRVRSLHIPRILCTPTAPFARTVATSEPAPLNPRHLYAAPSVRRGRRLHSACALRNTPRHLRAALHRRFRNRQRCGCLVDDEDAATGEIIPPPHPCPPPVPHHSRCLPSVLPSSRHPPPATRPASPPPTACRRHLPPAAAAYRLLPPPIPPIALPATPAARRPPLTARPSPVCGGGTVRVFIGSGNPTYYCPTRGRSEHPDAIVGLNAGLGTYISWQHVILRSFEFDIPFVITDYNETCLVNVQQIMDLLHQALTRAPASAEEIRLQVASFVPFSPGATRLTLYQPILKNILAEVQVADVDKVCAALRRDRPEKLNAFMRPGLLGDDYSTLGPGSLNACIQIITPVT